MDYAYYLKSKIEEKHTWCACGICVGFLYVKDSCVLQKDKPSGTNEDLFKVIDLTFSLWECV